MTVSRMDILSGFFACYINPPFYGYTAKTRIMMLIEYNSLGINTLRLFSQYDVVIVL